jgi:hypothetical protein
VPNGKKRVSLRDFLIYLTARLREGLYNPRSAAERILQETKKQTIGKPSGKTIEKPRSKQWRNHQGECTKPDRSFKVWGTLKPLEKVMTADESKEKDMQSVQTLDPTQFWTVQYDVARVRHVT